MEEQLPLLFGDDKHVALSYRGVDVLFDDERLVSLTDMYRAMGSPDGKEPRRWYQTDEAKSFIAQLIKNLNSVLNAVWKSKRGGHLGGTWAHWQVALAYAKYLSSDFHIFVNNAFREWAKEEVNPDLKATRAIDGYRRQGRSDAWIRARLEGIGERHGFTDTLQDHDVQGAGFAQCTNAINVKVLGGTAQEVKRKLGLPATAKTRDALTAPQLSSVMWAEAKSSERIEKKDVRGNRACVAVCDRAGEAIRRANEFMDEDDA